ncbi:hypothetical protein E4H12_06120 [Candidatus Thorarchaeota archaeon]|nr:MAG: hypothetical protein E4H12_06120 [Candidatus Thorarchaeota archaeon]
MALLQFILFIILALNISAMFSGFMLARRMGMYLMKQVMALMFAMMLSMGVLMVGIFLPTFQIAGIDLLLILLIVDFVLILLATLMQFGQILPILLKTMQGGPFHSSHMTNLLVTLFALLGLVIYYAELALM